MGLNRLAFLGYKAVALIHGLCLIGYKIYLWDEIPLNEFILILPLVLDIALPTLDKKMNLSQKPHD